MKSSLSLGNNSNFKTALAGMVLATSAEIGCVNKNYVPSTSPSVQTKESQLIDHMRDECDVSARVTATLLEDSNTTNTSPTTSGYNANVQLCSQLINKSKIGPESKTVFTLKDTPYLNAGLWMAGANYAVPAQEVGESINLSTGRVSANAYASFGSYQFIDVHAHNVPQAVFALNAGIGENTTVVDLGDAFLNLNVNFAGSFNFSEWLSSQPLVLDNNAYSSHESYFNLTSTLNLFPGSPLSIFYSESIYLFDQSKVPKLYSTIGASVDVTTILNKLKNPSKK